VRIYYHQLAEVPQQFGAHIDRVRFLDYNLHMPAPPRPQPPVDTIRVALSGTTAGAPWTCVQYLSVTTDGTKTAADLKTVIDAYAAAFYLRMKASLSISVILTDVKAVWITSVGNELAYEASVNDVMTGGAIVPNVATCIVLNWAIGAYYRGGHPRTYLPGPILGNTTANSQLTAAYQASIAAAAVLWLSDTNALTGTHILTTKLGTVSFQTAKAWRAPPIFRAYTSASVRAIFGTQRRRLGGR
jgi:hypothetical protein